MFRDTIRQQQIVNKFCNSSPLLERLKKFNIGGSTNNDSNTEDVAAITPNHTSSSSSSSTSSLLDCRHGNRSNSSLSSTHHQNDSLSATSEMWRVERSRVSVGSSSTTSSGLSGKTKTFYHHHHQRPGHSCNYRNSPSCRVEHVLDFVKIPEPTLLGHIPPTNLMEPLTGKKSNLQK